VATALAFSPRTRPLAKKIAAGMAGSFPGVFCFQLLSAPLIALFLLIIGGISHLFIPPDVLILVLLFFLISIPVVASLVGFYGGWRIGWELAAGRSARAFLESDRMLGPMLRFLRKRLPFLQRVL
jgi:hypothetical protein